MHKAAPFEKYILQRWLEGCHSPKILWLEIQKQGFTGSLSSFWRFLSHLKTINGDMSVSLQPKRLSPRQAARLLVTPEEQLNDFLQQYKKTLLTSYSYISELAALATQFVEMIKEQKPDLFSVWLEEAKKCKIPALQRFAKSLEKDSDAILAALQYDWSNGQLEGQVNRLKTIKRLMYGRANL